MASFTAGGGTLKSSTLEAAFWEGIFLLFIKERDLNVNPSEEKRIVFELDQDLIVRGSCNFPALETLASFDDSIVWVVSNYLNANFSFNPGTNGTLKTTNLPAAIIAIAKRLQSLEEQPLKNTQNLNRISLRYDSDAKTVHLDFACELIASISSTGQPILSAKTYLID